ncbi:MAG: DUF4321 domain-containing protein [Elusimicrobia bacterium]|nr:DUF4321 domain-containing protein [Elusimicrobiota bacterium]
MKTVLHILVVIVTGTLFGMVINKLGAIWFPQTGNVHSVISTAINTGLNPTTVDLGVVQFTLGLIFKFDTATVLGIFIAAFVYKQLIK